MRTRPTRPPLAAEPLEPRDVPALTVQFDFRYDATGFFNDPARRAVLQQAANDLTARISTPLAAVVPGGDNGWVLNTFDPFTGQSTAADGPALGANTLVVFVAGRQLPGATVAESSPGSYTAVGSGAWRSLLRNRGPAGATAWGGAISFDDSVNWYFGADAAGLPGNRSDFYSVAAHELGHVFGIGASRTWFAQVGDGAFVGPTAEAVYGGPVPVEADGSHWLDGLTVGGQPVALDPIITRGARVPFSVLDYAALVDLGWSVGDTPAPDPIATTQPNPEPWSGTWTSLSTVGGLVVLSGAEPGTARVFTTDPGGFLTPVGPAITPFLGGGGSVRAVAADFNGDGTPDLAFGTGPGATAAVRVLNGRTGTDMVGVTAVLGGFGGGTYLAAGDADGDGRAELAVSADAGGGTRVTLLRVAARGLTPAADFLAFDDPDFRGGSRVAMADVDRDGAADVVVGAGIGGGPRVAVYSGRSVAAGRPARQVPDFFALDPNLRSGVFVTAGDLDGDGYADVAYGTGDTGGPRVRVISGRVLTDNPRTDPFTLPALADFFALDPNDRKGLRIAARDVDGDGVAELVAASGAKDQAARVMVISLADAQSPTGPAAGAQDPFGGLTAADGVYVG
ncbi:MAG: FG-GAP-like repeat-containing protein [Gemmataceae bacterium]|nr:FG-GAP-like repeat-containing protein [Gemmataceae bacterium]